MKPSSRGGSVPKPLPSADVSLDADLLRSIFTGGDVALVFTARWDDKSRVYEKRVAEHACAGVVDVDVDGRIGGAIAGALEAMTTPMAPAEAPPGRVPARMSVNHFLFDSWVHERDLRLPAGEVPPIESVEAAAVLSYVVAIAGAARFDNDDLERPAISFDITTTDTDLCVHVERDAVATVVTVEAAPTERTRLAGTVGDVVDYATGRNSGDRLEGDPAALTFLRNLAVVMG